MLSSRKFWESAPSLEKDGPNPENVTNLLLGLYIIAVFDDQGNLIGLYVGQSIDMPLRAEQHGSQLDLTVDGLPAQQLIYLEGRKTASRVISALATFDDQASLTTIGVGEQALCWLLGTYRMRLFLVEARQARCLKVVPGKDSTVST